MKRMSTLAFGLAMMVSTIFSADNATLLQQTAATNVVTQPRPSRCARVAFATQCLMGTAILGISLYGVIANYVHQHNPEKTPPFNVLPEPDSWGREAFSIEAYNCDSRACVVYIIDDICNPHNSSSDSVRGACPPPLTLEFYPVRFRHYAPCRSDKQIKEVLPKFCAAIPNQKHNATSAQKLRAKIKSLEQARKPQ